ncbi:MAG: FtsH protease activity modulator HflK [Gammaproteobacteria bacterium]|nr:FtsH protease activity modulator HflK [Gammaproteobacteria bacterium]
MGWNEPPDGNKGKDPWGNRGNGEGPPDLDEIVRKMQRGFGGLFGNKPGGVGGGNELPTSWIIIGLLLLILWLSYDMFHAIDEQERGVVLRFGEYVTTLQPGLNIRMPRPIENVIRINVGQVRTLTHKASMLTQDENIVDVEVAVQWQISDPANFIFNVNGPTATLRQATESAVRRVIGKNKLDFVLTEGRGQITQDQQVVMQSILDSYAAGILVVTVEMQPAKPPEQVKAAFDDAIKAREDEQRLVNEAEAYSNDVIPKARGAAARLREESNAYKSKVIAKAEGEASRFVQLLTEYERAPAITRERLYLDSIEAVLSGTTKIMIDADGSNSLMYLPIDQLLKNKSNSTMNDIIPREFKPDNPNAESLQNIRDRVNSRVREIR